MLTVRGKSYAVVVFVTFIVIDVDFVVITENIQRESMLGQILVGVLKYKR